MGTDAQTLFLDANILFSAAYQEASRLNVFWQLPKVDLLTSTYALEEARRNLKSKDQRIRLEQLVKTLKIVSHDSLSAIPDDIFLRDKDRPILAAAINAKADFLITGDIQDFGEYFGTAIRGVIILPPADFLIKHS